MKIKVLTLFLAFLMSGIWNMVSAQYYGLTSKDVILKYGFELAGKNVDAYMTITVDGISHQNDNSMVVDCLYNMLDKKGKVHASAKMMGMGDGLIIPVKYDDGSYPLTEDFIFCQTENRMGYLMIVPAEMTVGQELEGGRFQSSVKMPLGGTVKSDITFSNLVVKEETKLTIKDGSEIDCFLIEGKVTGKAYRSNQDSVIRLWFAKDLGIVKEEVPAYLDTKKSYAATLIEINKK